MVKSAISEVQTETADRIMTIRMNRPQRKNALTHAMYAALTDAMNAAATDPAVRVVLLAGQPDVYCSGNDLQDFLEQPPAGEDAPVWRFLMGLAQFPKPLVAAVNGAAIGVGSTMLLHCDFVIVGDQARLQMPFARLGICPEAASSLLLPQLLGYRRAAELLLLGDPIDAARAVGLGIANRAVEAARCEEEARALARRLAAQPPQATRITKRLMRENQRQALLTTIKTEADLFVQLLAGGEAKEAMTAFVEKRAPDFSPFE